MHIVVSIDVDQDDNFAIQETERHHALLTIVFAYVLASDGEVVPNGFGAFEVQAMQANVASTLWLVPGSHPLIVSTI